MDAQLKLEAVLLKKGYRIDHIFITMCIKDFKAIFQSNQMYPGDDIVFNLFILLLEKQSLRQAYKKVQSVIKREKEKLEKANESGSRYIPDYTL